MRGTFANIRLRNELAPGTEGPWTTHLPSGERDERSSTPRCGTAAEGVPLVVLAGKEYGSGSSRDWAAKGPTLLGVRAVIAESYERIHRSNLVGMGVLPLQFRRATRPSRSASRAARRSRSAASASGVTPEQQVDGRGRPKDGTTVTFRATVRIDGAAEVEYFRHGGILQMVLRHMLAD